VLVVFLVSLDSLEIPACREQVELPDSQVSRAPSEQPE